MIETTECLHLRSKITGLKKLDNNTVAVSTKLHGAKIFSYDECSVLANINNENLNSQVSALTFSPNGEFLAFSVNSAIYILHIASKIIIKTIRTDSEQIDMLEFDLESKYIIAATRSGRILQYRYDGSSLLGRVFSFDIRDRKVNSRDTAAPVSSITFFKNNMACGGDCGTVFSINLHSRANKQIIKNDTARINSICYLDDSSIVSGDSKGNLYFNSLKEEKLTKKLETGFTSINQIILMPNPNYIVVTGDANHAALYDIKNYKLLQNRYIEFDDNVQNIIVADDYTLLASLGEKRIEKVILTNPTQLIPLIADNSLDKAFALVQKDPMLQESKEYLELEKAYKTIYNQALEALINQNKDKALQITAVFKYVDSKKEEIAALFKAFDNYTRFKTLYMEKKYALAYAMSVKFPPLTKTFQYKKMEENWKEVFKNAQRQIVHGRFDNAQTLLKDYATIAQKRPIIKLILNHNSNFIEFLKAMEAKEFQKIDTIAKSNELFTQIPTYKSIEDEMNKAIEEIQYDIHICQVDSAIEKLGKLQNIDSVKSKISAQINECKAAYILKEAYDKNDFLKCFETIDKHNSLNSTQIGVLLQKYWLGLISKCEGFALKGNIKDIKETLGELINLATRRDKIGDLFRVSFHTRIKGLIAKKAYRSAESIIYSYIDIFGLDNEIISIMKLFESISKAKLAITQTQEGRQSRDSWIYSDIIMGS